MNGVVFLLANRVEQQSLLVSGAVSAPTVDLRFVGVNSRDADGRPRFAGRGTLTMRLTTEEARGFVVGCYYGLTETLMPAVRTFDDSSVEASTEVSAEADPGRAAE